MIRTLMGAAGAPAFLAGTAATLLWAGGTTLEAQSGLAGRVAAADGPRVQFSFPARAGVCGDGRTFLSIDGSMHIGTFVSSESARAACQPGPVRVVLERADRNVIGLQTYVGPTGAAAEPVADLGTVPARDAADYLLMLAATLDGRPARDAIMPAALAEGVDASERLVAIARDPGRPIDARRSALSWLAREAESPAATRSVSSMLLGMARDAAQPRPMRQQAVSTLSRLEAGAGVPAVIELARSSDGWLARQAVSALARSGDPRARASVREIVQRSAHSDDVMAVAVRGLAGQYGTAQDVALVRSAYPRLPGESSRRAAISAIAERGGEENARWLIGIAADHDERATLRRSALSGARRAGASSTDLARLYDQGDNTLRAQVVSALAESADEAAVDKLLAIARSGDDRAIRRRAVSALARLDDPRVKAALAEIVER